MVKQLLDSSLDRKNILNNAYALETIREHLGIKGVTYEGELKFTLKEVADFYGVTRETVSRYLTNYANELRQNGYEVYTGPKLQSFMDFDSDIDITIKTRRVGVFNFKAFIYRHCYR